MDATRQLSSSGKILKIVGELPSSRYGLRAAVVENMIYVSCGDGGSDDLTVILSWDPLQEKWTHTGALKVARKYHAAVAILSNAIECAGDIDQLHKLASL